MLLVDGAILADIATIQEITAVKLRSDQGTINAVTTSNMFVHLKRENGGAVSRRLYT